MEALVDTTYAIEKRYRKNGELPGPSSHFSSTSEDCFRIDNLPHLAPCYLDYLTHPRLLGMVQEIVGGTVRLEQSDAHIRRVFQPLQPIREALSTTRRQARGPRCHCHNRSNIAL